MQRLAVVLFVLALLLAVAAAALAVLPSREQGWDQRVVAATTDVDRAFIRMGNALGRVVEAASSDWLEASEAPKEGISGQESEMAAWESVRATLGDPTVPAGTVVVLYRARKNAPPGDPFELLGLTTAERVVQKPPPEWKGRVPAPVLATLHAMIERGDATEDLVWFSASPEGGVRLHLLSPYLHTYDPEDESEEPVDVVALIEASAPFPAPEGVDLRIRCEVVAGEVDAALSPVQASGGVDAGGGAREGEAIMPSEVPATFLARKPEARAIVRVAAPATPKAPLLLLGGSFALLLLDAGLLFAARRRSSAAPPDVAAEAAHELRTPLTAMRGELEVALRRERPAGEYRQVLETCLDEVKGLQTFLDSVLLLTRGAHAQRANEPVDLTALVSAEVERVRAAHAERAVTVEGNPGPVVVSGDPSLLARAVGNLLDNAALHSVAGGGIRARVEASGHAARVVVEDDGPGIPEARREKVFERFYRGPEVGRRRIPGAGLGLPIARWIARLHGGDVVLLPASGRAVFVLTVSGTSPG